MLQNLRMSKKSSTFAPAFEKRAIIGVHSYIGITPDFGSEKRGSTPRWTTRAASAALIVEVRTTIKQKQPFPQKRRRVMEYTVLSNTNKF